MILTKKSYKIYKNEVFEGYLFGSLHMHMDPLDYEHLVKQLTPIVQEVSSIFIECKLPHHTRLAYGVERAVLASVESLGKSNCLHYFETADFQHAMLNSYIWCGDKIVAMPWHRYSLLIKYPRLCFWSSKIAQVFFKMYNIVYNIVTSGRHVRAVQAFSVEQHQILLKLISSYKAGEVIELSENDSDRYLMKPRNNSKVHYIHQNINSGNNALYVVGAAHLPGEFGIVQLLQAQGYLLEPWEF